MSRKNWLIPYRCQELLMFKECYALLALFLVALVGVLIIDINVPDINNIQNDGNTWELDKAAYWDGYYDAAIISQIIPPRVIESSLSEYPAQARANKRNGEVLLSCRIDVVGKPQFVCVVKSSGCSDLDATALHDVGQWKFSPAMCGNEPVEYVLLIPFRFTIRGNTGGIIYRR